MLNDCKNTTQPHGYLITPLTSPGIRRILITVLWMTPSQTRSGFKVSYLSVAWISQPSYIAGNPSAGKSILAVSVLDQLRTLGSITGDWKHALVYLFLLFQIRRFETAL
jgi:hypothetical protein